MVYAVAADSVFADFCDHVIEVCTVSVDDPVLASLCLLFVGLQLVLDLLLVAVLCNRYRVRHLAGGNATDCMILMQLLSLVARGMGRAWQNWLVLRIRLLLLRKSDYHIIDDLMRGASNRARVHLGR